MSIPMPDPFIIGLTGLAGSGKDTAADHLCTAYGFERYAFAQPLKAMVETLLQEAGVDHAYMFERNLKEQPIPGLDVSYRHLAQTLGTEWGRDLVGADLWVKLAARTLGIPDAPVHDRIVITDVRFFNEADWIRRLDGVVVRVQRDVQAVRAHTSEAQPLGNISVVLDNSGSKANLHDRIDELMYELDLDPRRALHDEASAAN